MRITNDDGLEFIFNHLYRYTGRSPYIEKDTVFVYVGDMTGRIGRFATEDRTWRGALNYNNMARHNPESNRQGVAFLYREEDTHE